MANQPETPNYDAGVYQLETADPVQGGVGGIANAPLLNLANRTAYLNIQVTSLKATVQTLAPINSPAFSGSPTSPTPPVSDNSNAIATTAWTRGQGFVTAATAPVTSVNAQIGTVTLRAGDVGALSNTGGTLSGNLTVSPGANVDATFVLATTGTPAGSYDQLAIIYPVSSGNVQDLYFRKHRSSDNAAVDLRWPDMIGGYIWHSGNLARVSTLSNDVGYVTAATAPVTSVANKTGAVALGLADLTNNFANIAVFGASTTWTVPAGVTLVRVTPVGGGGGGCGSNPGAGNLLTSGAGGGAGGAARGVFGVAPGASFAITVGLGGAGGTGTPGSMNGAPGGSSSFGNAISATGGGGGTWGDNFTSAGGVPGTGSGGALQLTGGCGGDGQSGTVNQAGMGGASIFGGGGRSGSPSGVQGTALGSGGGGSYGRAGNGGYGQQGVVIVEY